MSNWPEYINHSSLNYFISQAFKEDIGDGDHSTLAVIDVNNQGRAQLIIKADGVIAGVELAEIIFKKCDPEINFTANVKDGDRVNNGDIGFIVEGSSRAILSAERLVLNCMQRMSGIATKTANVVQMLQGTLTKVLDTRKTTPNFRLLEKWAVKIGGGENHRFGLYDMIMLKDNHIDMAGGIPKAIQKAREYLHQNNLNLKIEVETRTIDEVKQVLDVGGVDIIMLDNMMPPVMKEACMLIGKKAKTEASGGISELNISEVAESGINFISIGALTHSYTSLDMSLKAI